MDVQVLVAFNEITMGMICSGPAKHWVISNENPSIDVYKNGCLSIFPSEIASGAFWPHHTLLGPAGCRARTCRC